MVRQVDYDAAFTFAYSPRSGTPASDMLDQLTAAEKNLRLRQLIDLVNESSLRRNQALLGTVVEVLVEGPSKNDPGRLTGRTSGNKLVHFSSPGSKIGSLMKVRITQAQTWHLLGEPV